MNKKELLDAIVGKCNGGEVLERMLKINNKSYIIYPEGAEPTIDGGKYQYGANIFSVIEEGVEGVVMYIKQSYKKTGSYYSFQEYDFDYPVIVEKSQKVVEYWREV